MRNLAVLSAVLAIIAQALLMTTLWRIARSRRHGVLELSPEVARLHLEWSQLLTQVFLAARNTIAVCPACHLGADGPCECQERRQRLAVALNAAEEFAAAYATEAGSPSPVASPG